MKTVRFSFFSGFCLRRLRTFFAQHATRELKTAVA